MRRRIGSAALVLLFACAAPVLAGVEFAPESGALRVTGAGGAEVLRSGAEGLWRAEFLDGSAVTASDVVAAGGFRREEAGGAVRLTYDHPALSVVVTMGGDGEATDLLAEVAVRQGTLLRLDVPATLRFDARQVERFISPMNGNESVGAAFLGPFFEEQSSTDPAGWAPQPSGPSGYETLFGGRLEQRLDQDPPVALSVTTEGAAWLGPELGARVGQATAVVNRPPAEGQADLVLVDSSNGPWLSAKHLGAGGVFRIGGGVDAQTADLARAAVVASVERLVERAEPGATVAVLSLKRGPAQGGWTSVKVADWVSALANSPVLGQRGAKVVEVSSPDAMMVALAGPDAPLVVLNPYGEWAPVPDGAEMAKVVAGIRSYAEAGGNWFEVGGYPFHYALRPLRNLSYETGYPAGFADFQHLETTAGNVSVYRVAPRTWQAWDAARDPSACFVPGSLAHGRDDDGPYCRRSYQTCVETGATWTAPTVRIAMDLDALTALKRYTEENRLAAPLERKMIADVLERFRRSVLVYVNGSAREMLAALDLIPAPALIHTATYLRGGFDKQYPDHLPPRPDFGTPGEFKAVIDGCKERGHLFMPYTNPTWWCDDPPGPTFVAAGDAPLSVGLDGEPYREVYGTNPGWTTCFWHPAVRAANRETVRQFTEDYPVDVLFQDQCGARRSVYDTNPAAPGPATYTEGLLSMLQEDWLRAPLSTEAGWDGVVPYESQLCGMSWMLVPTQYAPEWRVLLRDRYPAGTWEPFPVAQAIAHGSAAMTHHDLGQFATNQEVLGWTLGLGFGLSYTTSLGALETEANRTWLLWLDALQKSVCARYTGAPLTAYEAADLGDARWVLRSEYGDLTVYASTAPADAALPNRADVVLAPYGFLAEAPGMLAGCVRKLGPCESTDPAGLSFVREDKGDSAEYTVYAPEREALSLPLPDGWTGAEGVKLDGTGIAASAEGGVLRIETPFHGDEEAPAPPDELAATPMGDWPDPFRSRGIGVLALNNGPPGSWSEISPQAWIEALENSGAIRETGLSVVAIRTPEEFARMLIEGRRMWFAIVNPYGETFPTAEGLDAKQTLEAIRDYVRNGGVWWETAGYSFYRGMALQPDGTWTPDNLGPSGLDSFGLGTVGDPVEAPAVSVHVTEAGRAMLSEEIAALVDATPARANRASTTRPGGPTSVALVASANRDYITGHQLRGWGWLFRFGGFWPPPEVAPGVVADVLAHIWSEPPSASTGARGTFVWTVRARRAG